MAFPSFPSYTQLRALPASTRRAPCDVVRTFAMSFPMPLLIFYNVNFLLHLVICSPNARLACIHFASSISRTSRYMMFRAFLSTQPRAFFLGFLVGSLPHSLVILLTPLPHVFSRSLHREFPASSFFMIPCAFPVSS